MQYNQALNEIESTRRIYRKGCITLGEYITKLGVILISFELEITRNDTEEIRIILSNHQGWKDVSSAVYKAINQ